MLTRPRRLAASLAVVLVVPCASGARAATSGCLVAAPDVLALQALCDRAHRQVEAAWGPVGPVRVEVAASSSDAAATTTGSTVVVNPRLWSTLSAVGRAVVLTHELVHVATRATTTATTPLWLVEGVADEVALRGSGLSARRAAAELAAQVRTGQVPTALPRPVDFARDPAVAYEGAWLAVDLLTRRYGGPALRALYARAGVVGLDTALAEVDATTAAAVTEAWRAQLRRTLG